MNNTINNVSNLSFNSRYLNLTGKDRIPQTVYDAVYKSDAIDEFLKAGKPKTFLQKIKNLFKKDTPLNISYIETIVPLTTRDIPKDRLRDPYSRACNLIIRYNNSQRELLFIGEQRGTKRQSGSIPKPGESYEYKPPFESAEDKLAKKIEELKIEDLNSLL